MDRLFAIIALATLIGFLGVVVGFVPEPDLIIVFVIVIAMAIYDFWKTIGPKPKSDQD